MKKISPEKLYFCVRPKKFTGTWKTTKQKKTQEDGEISLVNKQKTTKHEEILKRMYKK